MIITLAGRRIDAPDATVPRFPLARSAVVRERILTLLREQHATALVSAAACGADLLALNAAGELGIRRYVVLPFSRERFRALSVVDRPGEWGTLFDQIISDVEAAGDLLLLNETQENTAALVRTNKAILNRAQALVHEAVKVNANASPPAVLAVIVWDGQPRGEGDLTANFADEARSRNIPVAEIATQ